jgi:DUF4097 and DUF4098 domain-containing protein YvlB
MREAAMRRFVPLTLVVLFAACGCVNAADDGADGDADSHVNGSVHVPDGAQRGDVSTVNGSIHVGSAATVADAHTVNGSITLGARSKAASIHTVNGAVTLDPGCQVKDDIKSINGALKLRDDVQVTGSIENVNGLIELTAAHVSGELETVNGDINLSGSTHVDGGILVKRPHGSFNLEMHVPRVVIGPGATVGGELHFERAVKLYVSDQATIGPVTGATAIRFSGNAPPIDL